jgi:hypothetical protein
MKTTYKVIVAGEKDIAPAEFATYALACDWARKLQAKGWEVRVDIETKCLWDCT